MSEILIRPALGGEEVALSALAWRVFDRDVAPLYTAAGCEAFRQFASTDAMVGRAADNARWVALARGEIVGMLEVRDGTHVAMLFVDGDWQRRGISRRLLVAAFGPVDGWPMLTVNSAPDAVGAYERLGFVATAGQQEADNGIRFIPMRRAAASGVTGP